MAKKDKSKKEKCVSEKEAESPSGRTISNLLKCVVPAAIAIGALGLLLACADSSITFESEDPIGAVPNEPEVLRAIGHTVEIDPHIRTYTTESGRKATAANHQYAEEQGVHGLLDNQSYVRKHERTYARAA